MKKLFISFVAVFAMFCNCAFAHRMVQEENYLKNELVITGVPDFPPFSFYTKNGSTHIYSSAFFKPLENALKKYNIKFKDLTTDDYSFKNIILKTRSGEANLFIGAYSNTKLFTGLELVYPSHIYNPIHIITLPDTKDKIKVGSDLLKLKGVVSTSEYFSDFILRKIKPLDIKFVDSPLEAYKLLFTGKADYIIGSMYYNKIMASRVGVEPYLAYSSKPIFKIPVFVTVSLQTPRAKLYVKAISDEIKKPEFIKEVKLEILRAVEGEIAKNQGIVPPSFAENITKPQITETVEKPVEKETGVLGGKIIEKEEKKVNINDIIKDI